MCVGEVEWGGVPTSLFVCVCVCVRVSSHSIQEKVH